VASNYLLEAGTDGYLLEDGSGVLLLEGTFFDDVRADIIAGLDSAQAEGTGWNAEVRDKEVVASVVRTSDTVVTVTLSAQAAYDITAQETITVTVPAVAVLAGNAIVATPTFTVDTAGGAPAAPPDTSFYRMTIQGAHFG
jgi:hypothetical protein